MAIQKSYKYEVWHGLVANDLININLGNPVTTGTYVGVLPTVTSDFALNQTINSVGTQLQIVVAQTTDVATLPTGPLTDESGATLTDESGATLYQDRQPDIVGESNSGILIANDNNVVVREFSQYHPNGIVVFIGYISKWKVDYGNDTVTITCLSMSQDLSNYIIPGTNATAIDSSYIADHSAGSSIEVSQSGLVYRQVLGQSFKTGSTTTLITAISLSMDYFNTPGVVTVRLYTSAGGSLLGTATATPTSGGGAPNAQEWIFTFASPISVSPSTTYFFSVQPQYPSSSGGTNFSPGNDIYGSNTYNAYAGANSQVMYPDGDGSGGHTAGVWYSNSGTPFVQTFWYKAWASVSTSSTTFTNEDPANILADIMTAYQSKGGSVLVPANVNWGAPYGMGGPGGFDATMYLPTNTLTTYTFKLNTVLQGVQQVLALGPANYYFYVDPATNALFYLPANTVADYTLVKGRHINALTIEATKEQIFNYVYFSGGDDGSGHNTTIFVEVTDTTSIVNNRRGLALLSDNRVTGVNGGTSTARQVAQNYINTHNVETYITNVTIQDGTMDISRFKLGQMVGFAGFGNFTDQLLLQIVGINYTPEQVTLSLGTLPKRATQTVESILSQLAALQTIANPSAPA